MCRDLGDLAGQARAQAALDLAENLPGVWGPNQVGGYAMAALPVGVGADGYTWHDPQAVVNYSWGGPSRCAGLIHLFRPRRFLGPSLELGAEWEDRIEHRGDGMSWGIEDGDTEPVARSRVEGVDDEISTPAGRFTGCLRVRTTITGGASGRATEHSTRSYCGLRTAWFAPGVGLVKLRHEDQNDTVWTVYLTAHEGPPSDAHLPLEPGHEWRYRWIGESDEGLFEDICRVGGSEGGVTYLASATWAVEQPKEEELGYLEHTLELERASGDLAGQSIAMAQIKSRCEDEERRHRYERRFVSLFEEALEPARAAGNMEDQLTALRGIASYSQDGERRRACALEAAEICERQGDEWSALLARQGTHKDDGEPPPAQVEAWSVERLELARRLGDRGRETETLHELANHHLDHEGYQAAAQLFGECGAALAEAGDTDEAADGYSMADLARALQIRPPGPDCGYAHGWALLTSREGKLVHEITSRGPWHKQDRYPPRPATTHMTVFLTLGPFDGLELLTKGEGESCTERDNTGLGGVCESMRNTSMLKSKSEEIDVLAGRFVNCALIEATMSTSEEERPFDAERLKEIRGYGAGTREAWFAPGVGVVKLRYRHQNGYETCAELMDYEVIDESEDYLPLALGNRWRYRWTDTKSGVGFEDSLRVCACRDDRWNISFVTRAEAG